MGEYRSKLRNRIPASVPSRRCHSRGSYVCALNAFPGYSRVLWKSRYELSDQKPRQIHLAQETGVVVGVKGGEMNENEVSICE